MRDATRLIAAGFLRSIATGMTGVLLGLYASRLGTGPAVAGLLVSAGLAGAALATALVTFRARGADPRRSLAVVATLCGVGTLGTAAAGHPAAIAIAAFVGMVNGMGRDRGAALVLEQSLLPDTVGDAGRTRAFAWYHAFQDAGHALGSLAAALPAFLAHLGWEPLGACRLSLAATAPLFLAGLPFYRGLRIGAVARETEPIAAKRSSTRSTRRILARVIPLFALDALGSGFLTTALLSYFFFERFGASATVVAFLFAAARVLNALSHLGAAWLARRIGLVNTMVFTHIPSSLLMASIAIVPDFTMASCFFLLREGLVEMDVPTRQSWLMAVVPPEDRVLASGSTQLARLGAWAVAPAISGALMQGVSLLVPLVVGSALKIGYDVMLYASFRRVRAPEER